MRGTRPFAVPCLVVQHPALTDAVVDTFGREAGVGCARRTSTLAVWPSVSIAPSRVATLADALGVDAELIVRERCLAHFRLAAFDMDSTLITNECVDEIADHVGCRAEVTAITAAAMRGELADYDESLRRRVAMLAGMRRPSAASSSSRAHWSAARRRRPSSSATVRTTST